MAETGDTPSMQWVITFDGQVFREADLTIGEMEQMEEALNTTWWFIKPLRSATHAKAILTTLLVSRNGMAKDDAAKRVGAIKATDYLDMLSEEEEGADLPTEFNDGFPQPAAEPSTPG